MSRFPLCPVGRCLRPVSDDDCSILTAQGSSTASEGLCLAFLREEDAVALLPDQGEHIDRRLRRVRFECKAFFCCLPLHGRRILDELASEAVLLITDCVSLTDVAPADVEGDSRRHRRLQGTTRERVRN